MKATVIKVLLPFSLTCALLYAWLSHAWLANLQHASGWWILFMDERLFIDAMKPILDSQSVLEFWKSLIGPDMRYGRSVFYLPALLYSSGLFGDSDSALIVLNRMLLASTQALGFGLISYVCFKNWWGVLIGLAFGLSSPFSAYYSMMPKPEPYLILVIGLFLWFRSQGHFRAMWASLGFAIGLKISILPFVLVFAAFEKLKGHLPRRVLFPFLIGFLLNVPALLELRLREYLWWLKANIRHGADSPDVTPIRWITHFGSEYLAASYLGFIWVAAVVALGAVLCVPLIKDRKSFLRVLDSPSTLVFVMGASFFLPIMVSVKRLWGLYLHVGHFLIGISAMMILWHSYRTKVRGPQTYLAAALLFFTFTVLPDRISANLKEFDLASKRDSQQEYAVELEKKNLIHEYLTRHHWSQAIISGFLPYDKYELRPRKLEEMWGPFKDWGKGFDLIFNVSTACEERDDEIAADANAEACKEGRLGRARHLENSQGSCEATPCYRFKSYPNGLNVYWKVAR